VGATACCSTPTTSRVADAVHTQTLPFVTPEVVQVYADVETALYAAALRPGAALTDVSAGSVGGVR
jgi:hypothetical protein